MRAVILLWLLMSVAQQQKDISGKWVWQAGDGRQRIALTLKSDKTKFTGTVEMGEDTTPRTNAVLPQDYKRGVVVFKIKNGKLEGETLSFEHDLGASRSGKMTVRYMGRVQGDSIVLTRETRNFPLGADYYETQFLLRRVQ